MIETKIEVEKTKKPVIVGIPISNVCNSKCDYCIRDKYSFSHDDFMAEDMFIKLIDNVKEETQYLNISAGYGEAILHPEIENYIELAHKSDVKILMYTNGKMIIEYIDILKKVDKLIVSANNNTFDVNNIRYLDKLHDVTISILFDLRCNDFEYIQEICKFCDSHSIDVELKCVFNNTNIQLKEKSQVSYELNELLNNKFKYIHVMPNLRYKFIHCKDPWRAMYFDMEGYLRPCCIFYESIKDYNIFYNKLSDIWNSKYLEDRREGFKKGQHDKYCIGCPIGFGNVGDYRFGI